MIAKHNYARCFLEMKDYRKAEKLFSDAFEECKEVMGVYHEDTLNSKFNLAFSIGK